jgi:hypothetical protein
MNYLHTIAVSAAMLLLIGAWGNKSNTTQDPDPIPAGCEATPVTLNTSVQDYKDTGFDKIDIFNVSAKAFRLQTLNIADSALKLTVTMCQVPDPELGEITHRECFTGLDLARSTDCANAIKKEGKAAMLERLTTIIVDGTAAVALGTNLVVQSTEVSKATIEEVKGNKLKLLNANKAVKSLDDTTKDIKGSIEALNSAIKYAQGTKAAIESWELQ